MSINMRPVYRFLSLIFVILMMSSIDFALSQVHIETSVDKDTLIIGEPLNLNLEIDYPNGALLDVPNESNTFAPLEILDQKIEEPELIDENRFRKTVTFSLAVYDTGRIIIPPAMIIATSFVGEESKADSVFTDLVDIYCRISKPDTLQSIHGAADLHKDDYTLIIIIILLAIIAAGYFLWRWYVKRKADRLRFGSDRTIIEPPEVTAMARLAHLKKSGWLNQKEYKKWYTELNELWREYIEKRYPHILAMEMTSTELIPGLNEFMDKDDVMQATDFIKISDLVKFARYNPESVEHQKHMSWVEQWINRDTALAERKLQEMEDADQS